MKSTDGFLDNYTKNRCYLNEDGIASYISPWS